MVLGCNRASSRFVFFRSPHVVRRGEFLQPEARCLARAAEFVVGGEHHQDLLHGDRGMGWLAASPLERGSSHQAVNRLDIVMATPAGFPMKRVSRCILNRRGKGKRLGDMKLNLIILQLQRQHFQASASRCQIEHLGSAKSQIRALPRP